MAEAAHALPVPLGLVTVDAMRTVFLMRKALARVTGDVYRSEGRLDVGNNDVVRSVTKNRARFSSDLLDDEYWLHVNLAVIQELAPKMQVHLAAAAAKRIHERFLGDDRLYRVNKDLMTIIFRLRQRGVRVVLASNQREGALKALLRKFAIAGSFDAVYTSERLGVRKPNASFWQQILAEEEVFGPATRHIGNSPRSDYGAAALGIHTAILDTRHELEACRRNPDILVPGTSTEETARIREFLERGLLFPFHEMRDLRACMEHRGMI